MTLSALPISPSWSKLTWPRILCVEIKTTVKSIERKFSRNCQTYKYSTWETETMSLYHLRHPMRMGMKVVRMSTRSSCKIWTLKWDSVWSTEKWVMRSWEGWVWCPRSLMKILEKVENQSRKIMIKKVGRQEASTHHNYMEMSHQMVMKMKMEMKMGTTTRKNLHQRSKKQVNEYLLIIWCK